MRGALVLISHDRRFLTRLSRTTVWLDRGRTMRLDRGFGGFEAWRDQLLEEECQKFISIYKPDSDHVLPAKNFLKAYVADPKVREIIESRRFADFATSPVGDDFRILNKDLRKIIPEYVKDYVSLNKFM